MGKDIYLEKVVSTKYWVMKLMELYDSDTKVYVSFDKQRRILTYSMDDTIKEYMDKDRSFIRETSLKYLYQLCLKYELKHVDDFIIFLVSYKGSNQITFEELAQRLGISRDEVISITNGSTRLSDEKKLEYCKMLGYSEYDILRSFDIVFID